MFQFLLLLVFQGKNLFRFLNFKHKDQAVSKNTYYRFLNETSYNWRKFLLLLAAKVTAAFDRLTRLERVKVLVLDDSVIKRNRSRKVELLAAKSNRYQEISDGIDHRSNGYKTRKENLMSKTDAAVLMIESALNAGISADYFLMDTWFTTEPMIKSIVAKGLDVIGMVKQLNQRYNYKGKAYTLPELQKFVSFDNARNIFGSLCVTTQSCFHSNKSNHF